MIGWRIFLALTVISLCISSLVLSQGSVWGQEVSASVVDALIEQLKDDNQVVHERAAVALSSIGRDTVPALIKALRHEDSDVRERAAFALRGIGPEATAAVPALIEALKE